MPDRERKRVADHRSDALKGSRPRGPPAHPRNTEYPSITFFLMRVLHSMNTPHRPTPHPSSKINHDVLSFFLIIIYNSKYFLAWL